MPDFLRDRIWQFIGVPTTIIVGLVIYLLQHRRKALSYRILTNASLLGIEDAIKGRVNVLFDNQPVQNVRLIEIRIENSGNLPILPADYERPVVLGFAHDATVLSAEVSASDPDNLGATLFVGETEVALNPILLNRRDSVTLKVLVNQVGRDVNIEGRIVGVRTIRNREHVRYWLVALMTLFVNLGFVAAGGGAILDAFEVTDDFQPTVMIRIGVGFFVVAVLLAVADSIIGTIQKWRTGKSTS